MKYMLKNKAFILVIFIGIIIITSSCKKSFLDINDNPNAVTELNVTPELIFPAGATGVAARAVGPNFLQNWLGYFAPPGDFSINQQETAYNIDFTFGQGFWQNHYNVLFDLNLVETKALAKGDSVLAGAASILSVKLWQELVDLYGNIPYTDAFHVERTTTPKYDKAEDVYLALHKKLDQAVSYMKGTARATYPAVVQSVVKFGAGGGSVASHQANFIKYANTLKLRLLLRTSEVTVAGINTNAEIAKIVANGGVLQSGQTISVNPGYVDELNKQSPFYATYGFTSTGTDGNTAVRANVYTVNLMNATNDPRLQRLYRNVGASATGGGTTVAGVKYGQATPANLFGNASSKLGLGTAGTATQNAWVLTSVESLFLQAEAVARGWLTVAGGAQAAYQAAVTESFIFLGVPNATIEATTYFTTNAGANFSTVAAGTVTDISKFISYQKYIAMNSLDAVEAYSDLRKFNFSTIVNQSYISVNPSKLASKLPNRLLYPQEEYTLNFANVSAQGTISTATIFTGSKIFWQP